MASVLTQIPPFEVSALKTCPVILKGREGIDYVVKKFKTKTSSSIMMRDLVKIDGTNVDIVDICTSGDFPFGIVIDSVDNRKLLQSQNSGVWDYATAFSNASLVDVAILLKPCIVSLKTTASNAINIGSKLICTTVGDVGLWAVTAVRASGGSTDTNISEATCIGKSLSKQTSGTGAQIIAAILYP